MLCHCFRLRIVLFFFLGQEHRAFILVFTPNLVYVCFHLVLSYGLWNCVLITQFLHRFCLHGKVHFLGTRWWYGNLNIRQLFWTQPHVHFEFWRSRITTTRLYINFWRTDSFIGLEEYYLLCWQIFISFRLIYWIVRKHIELLDNLLLILLNLRIDNCYFLVL